jgi:CheY-like chemotaxis protein
MKTRGSRTRTIAPRRLGVFEDNPRFAAPVSGNSIFVLASMLSPPLYRDTGCMNVEPQTAALRIVIVDDNRHFLDAARNVLQQEGFDVVGVASTGAEALDVAGQLRPDAILVDVDLGDESGFDVAQSLEAAGAQASVDLRISGVELADLIAASPAVVFVSKSELSATAVSNLRHRASLTSWRVEHDDRERVDGRLPIARAELGEDAVDVLLGAFGHGEPTSDTGIQYPRHERALRARAAASERIVPVAHTQLVYEARSTTEPPWAIRSTVWMKAATS